MNINQVFDQVHKFYSSELIYFPQFMPKPGDTNQVYFPYCKYTLDKEGLLAWIATQEITEEFISFLDNGLFNKDKYILQLIK
jgi:hypothetical protein